MISNLMLSARNAELQSWPCGSGRRGPCRINQWRAGLRILRGERAGYGTPSAKDRDRDSKETAASFAGLLGDERNRCP